MSILGKEWAKKKEKEKNLYPSCFVNVSNWRYFIVVWRFECPNLLMISSGGIFWFVQIEALRWRRLCQFHFLKPSFLITSPIKRGCSCQCLKTLPLPVLPFKHGGIGILLGVKLLFLLYLVHKVIKSLSISSYLKRIASIIRQPVCSTNSINKTCSGEHIDLTVSISSSEGICFKFI